MLLILFSAAFFQIDAKGFEVQFKVRSRILDIWNVFSFVGLV